MSQLTATCLTDGVVPFLVRHIDTQERTATTPRAVVVSGTCPRCGEPVATYLRGTVPDLAVAGPGDEVDWQRFDARQAERPR